MEAGTTYLGDVDGVHDDGGDRDGGELALEQPELSTPAAGVGTTRRRRRCGGLLMRRRAVAEEVDQRGGGGHPCGERAPGPGHHGTGLAWPTKP